MNWLRSTLGMSEETPAGKEVAAGFTTFLTMSYILLVNPMILGDAGMDFDAVLTATGLAACFGTLLMAFWVKAPLAMAPGMGLNAFFAYTLVVGEGISWQTALGVVFISGVVFLVLTLAGIREKIVNAIPLSLRLAIPAGIGLFITFIGFQNMGLIVPDEATMLALGSFGPELLLGLVGLLIIVMLESKKIKGSILIGIVVTTALAIITGHVHWDGSFFSMPPSPAPVAFELDVLGALQWGLVGAVFSFMFVDLFDSVGTLVACSYEADMVEEDGSIHKIDTMLEADAAATVFGSLMGTSTTTTYIESASGIEDGGRTGLTALVTALLFLAALFFSPLIALVPDYATAPALVVVGVFMFRNIRQIPLDDWGDLVPAFLAIILMPLTYSISLGLTFGFLAWIFLKIGSGKFSEIGWVMWIVGILSAINLVITGM
ncbi:NCS2 family permease [Gracilimonas mengyeensis]|uniref:Putative MFS transporter, AGZA family, xanthine/uracil permease n=1 Tax=Gracilimonas mengyeensis TaxID=1302730 RepID=A0A521BVB4_9BACT|nr:NCS2 family permease [Gracilimonas mengyeensis]SMO51109.1 putative MFS transporter, AGZA family, xanthine/uracil permease [Gracilimonas mengyeensis]